jgi:hypothetical protein
LDFELHRISQGKLLITTATYGNHGLVHSLSESFRSFSFQYFLAVFCALGAKPNGGSGYIMVHPGAGSFCKAWISEVETVALPWLVPSTGNVL